MKEKEIIKITYEFEDKTKLVLTGKELEDHVSVSGMQSDYALPANEESRVKSTGMIRGFTPIPNI